MAKENSSTVKFGSGHMAAMARMGFKELGSAFVPEGSNVAQPGGEYGLFGQPTPGMIADSMERGGEGSILASRLPNPTAPTPERDDRGMERE